MQARVASWALGVLMALAGLVRKTHRPRQGDPPPVSASQ